MKITIKILLALIVLSSLCCFGTGNNISLQKDRNFPKWLEANDLRTDQTSGIAFVKTNGDGSRLFLLADDTGSLYHLILRNDNSIALEKIRFSDKVNELLSRFPKKDFEEITYDKYTGKVYLSIEGNGNDYKNFTGIYEVIFEKDDPTGSEVEDLKRMEFKPGELFLRHTYRNLGYEGMTLDSEYFYLGLESTSKDVFFSDSTLILVADKKTLEIKKVISTKGTGIRTICGLASPAERIIAGIDRNSKSMFFLYLDKDLQITDHMITDISTSIPEFEELDYIAALESITIDDQSQVYFVDDPWKERFIPNEVILSRVDKRTRQNFSRYIPIIYKYKLNLNN